MSDPEEQHPAPKSGGVLPLLGWITVMVAIGGTLGVLGPWRTSSSDRFTQTPPAKLVERLADPKTRTTTYLKLKDQRFKEETRTEAIPHLLKAAQDPGYAAREEAIELLGWFGAKEAIPFLLSLAAPELQQVRLTCLGRLRGAEALAAVRKGLAAEDLPLQMVAVQTLADWEGTLPPDVLGEIRPYLTHAEFGMREFAAKYMGAQKVKTETATLIGMLKDEHPSVRKMAAWSLRQIKDPQGLTAVDEAIEAGAVPPDE